MQARKALLTLLLLLTLGLGSLHAQYLFSVSWDTANVPAPSSQVPNDTVNYTFRIHNLSPLPFQDTVIIMGRTALATFAIDTLDSFFVDSLSFTTVSVRDSTLATRYGGGVNVVVVWPTSPAGIEVLDSLIDTLTIIPVNLDPVREDAMDIVAYPVPHREKIYLHQVGPPIPVVSVDLINLAGQVILHYPSLPASIPIENLPPSIYYLRVEGENAFVTTIKLIKQ